MKEVRDVIDASLHVERAAEEVQMLQLHAVHMIHWLNIQADALLKAPAINELTNKYIKIRLLQRLWMFRSMLGIKDHDNLVDEELKVGLISLEIRILQRLSAVELVGQGRQTPSESGEGEPGGQEVPVDEDESDEDDVGVVDDDDNEAFEVLESEIEKMGDTSRKEAGTEVAAEDTETEVAEEDAETDRVGASTEAAGEDGGVDRDSHP